MLKKKTTNRKFYGKWLYKVTLDVPGIAILRQIKTVEEVIHFIDHKIPVGDHPKYSVYYKVKSNADSIKSFCLFLKDIDPTIWSKRIERNSIDIYTNDVGMYTNLCENFNSLVLTHHEPIDASLENSDQYTIVAKKLPHNLYRYKVFLKPHVLANDKDAKNQLANWMDEQGEKVLISPTVKEWFIKTDWNWDRRYVLVDNEQTLLMLKLRGAGAVGKVYEYKLVDK